jgi:hypothetical protein
MSEHSTPEPASNGGTPHLPSIDLVAGDPPVPITVWRTARSGDDQSATISARLAYRLIAVSRGVGRARQIAAPHPGRWGALTAVHGEYRRRLARPGRSAWVCPAS